MLGENIRLVIAALMIVLILLPISYIHVVSSESTTLITQSAENSFTSLNVKERRNDTSVEVKFKVIVMRVGSISQLIGARADSLHIVSCIDGVPVPGSVYVVPRRFTETFMTALNRTVPIPELGDSILRPDDILILFIPVKVGEQSRSITEIGNNSFTLTPLCGWSIGLDERALIHIPTGVPTIDLQIGSRNVVKSLLTPIAFHIYFTHNNHVLAPVSIINVPLYKKLAKIFDLDLNNITELNTELKERLAKIVVTPSRVVYERAKDVLTPQEISTTAWLIEGGGGGPSQFYRFSLVLWNFTTVGDTISKTLYMGRYVYVAGINIAANSTSSTSSSCLLISYRVYDVSTGATIGSNTISYWLDATLTHIYLYPQTSYDKYINITITLQHCGGAAPYVSIVSLYFDKVYPSMPTTQTVKAYQILSAALYNWRAVCPGRASQYVESLGQEYGLYYYSTITSLSIEYKGLNGVFVDLNNPDGYLYIDLFIRNTASQSKNGTISIKINGVTIRNISTTLTKYEGRCLRFNIPVDLLLDHTRWGNGGIITIENTFNSQDIHIYVDTIIEYSYAPEVWDPNNQDSWQAYASAMKIIFYQNIGSVTAYETSIIFEPLYAPSWTSSHIAARLKLVRISSTTTPSICLTLKTPSAAGYVHGVKPWTQISRLLEKWLSLILLSYERTSMILTLLTIIDVMPRWVSGSTAGIGMILGSLYVGIPKGSIFCNSTYTMCTYCWSPGWSNPEKVELTFGRGVPADYSGDVTINIGVSIWDTWILDYNKFLTTIHVVNKPPSGNMEPPGFYRVPGIGYS